MNTRMGLDFETYSPVDIRKHALDRYINHPNFRPLIASLVSSEYGTVRVQEFDFVRDPFAEENFKKVLAEQTWELVAHNAPFEIEVLKKMGVNLSRLMFLDSAVIGRVAGAKSKLEQAAPQLLDVPKMEEGLDLIKLFSVPSKQQELENDLEFDSNLPAKHPDKWDLFQKYCNKDAELSLEIATEYLSRLDPWEIDFNEATERMNQVGWHVDMDLVHVMQQRYFENQQEALDAFQRRLDPNKELNFNSFPKLKKWCNERGVKAKSFDEKHVAQMLDRVQKRLSSMTPDSKNFTEYHEVVEMLVTKQILGGSSLKKLQTIIDQTGEDGRLRNQYLHAGAGQTLRTSGRGVQMQNLKRMGYVQDMSLVYDPAVTWDNDALAENLRQVFCAEDPGGLMIVGDLSSIESRGLAYVAGETWKTQAYRDGKGMYELLAAKIFNKAYEDVTKGERQTGKVGELSCGYGAGGPAVAAFAENMGVAMTEAEAASLVGDWRAANPAIVRFWKMLDELLHYVVTHRVPSDFSQMNGFSVEMKPLAMPRSLEKLAPPEATSISVELSYQGQLLFRRIFHGCYIRGRNVGYYKPTGTKSGPAWTPHFRDPKTGQLKYYNLYGGKLTGILVQSFCRQLFFHILRSLEISLQGVNNARIVGQFHDELVVEWSRPDRSFSQGVISSADMAALMHRIMVEPLSTFPDFPMGAEVKSAYRYIK